MYVKRDEILCKKQCKIAVNVFVKFELGVLACFVKGCVSGMKNIRCADVTLLEVYILVKVISTPEHWCPNSLGSPPSELPL